MADSVRVRTDVRQLVEDVRARELARVGQELHDAVTEAFARARAAWPVDTGLSRSQLTLVRSGLLDWRLRGDAPYTSAIVSRGVQVARVILVEPVSRAVRDVLAGGARE